MMREATERCVAKPTAHAMRAAALRVARAGAGEESDPAIAYGCVDWFRYDAAPPPQKAETVPPAAAGTAGVRQAATPPAH